MSEKEPDALRLADELLEQHQDDFYLVCDEAAIELRCLHAENSSLLAECDRLKALNAELAAVLETIVRDADGRRISGNLILDENSPVIVAARSVLAEHKGEKE